MLVLLSMSNAPFAQISPLSFLLNRSEVSYKRQHTVCDGSGREELCSSMRGSRRVISLYCTVHQGWGVSKSVLERFSGCAPSWARQVGRPPAENVTVNGTMRQHVLCGACCMFSVMQKPHPPIAWKSPFSKFLYAWVLPNSPKALNHCPNRPRRLEGKESEHRENV